MTRALLATGLWIAAVSSGIMSDKDASAAAIYRDKASYLAAAGTSGVATFEDIAPGQTPVVSGGVAFAGPVVVENLVNLPYQFWFDDLGSPTRFILGGFPPGRPPIALGFQATFPTDVVASGFIFNCFACDPLPNDSLFEWKTLDGSGNVVEEGSIVVDLLGVSGLPPPQFLGLIASTPFRTLLMTRRSVSQTATGNWEADDVRYSVALPTIAAIPTLSIPTLLFTALLLSASAWMSLRRWTARP